MNTAVQLMIITMAPVMAPAVIYPKPGARLLNRMMSNGSEPRTMLGTVVAAVARRLVPKCSAAMVTNSAQKPVPKPMSIQIRYMPVREPLSW